jgi:acetylornithine deacetylase/succinyl-diaminopimelate desuccinylase-like protein
MEQAWLDELSDFLRIPSVSADPEHAGDVRAAAEWVRDFVRTAGGDAELVETDAQPLVIGEIAADTGADAPTILVYGHFDVQPPAPLELWESDPFEATVRGEWIYARGIADDKGQLWTLLKAAALLKAERALPVNIRIACDGEEEIGGHSIVEFLEHDERGAKACIIFDGGMERRGVPMITTGTRGVMSMTLEVRTGQRDLHSGVFGNAALNATHALMQALGGILPRANGRLPEPLRAGIEPASEAEQESWSELTPGRDVLTAAGAVPNDANAAGEFYLRTTAEPAVDVNGILGGKPGLRNTTIPVHAQANFSVRLAPGQKVETIAAAVEQLIREAAPEGAEVTVSLDAAAPAGLVPPDHPAIEIALDAFEHVFQRRPLLSRTGGTLPIVPALVDKGIPTILSGISLPESSIHSPNERLLLEYLPLGVDVSRELFTRLAQLD